MKHLYLFILVLLLTCSNQLGENMRTVYPYSVDSFSSDNPDYIHYQTTYYAGSEANFIAPSSANFPNSGSATRYFLYVPFIVDISDLAGSKPIIARDVTSSTNLTTVSGSPSANQIRYVGTDTSTMRDVLEINSAQAGHTIGLDLYIKGGASNITSGIPMIYRTSAGVETFRWIRHKKIEIGDWNMDTTDSVTITHGVVNFTSITLHNISIINDDGSTIQQLTLYSGGAAPEGYFGSITSTTIQLFRVASGSFDTTDYNATSYNRGYIVISYED
jgi:hypothetical protein